MRGYLGQTLAFLHNQAHSILLELRSERATEPGCSLCHGSPPSPSRLLSGCPLLRATPGRCTLSSPRGEPPHYVYVMQFDGDKIRHMTKIWNDAISLKQLGWA